MSSGPFGNWWQNFLWRRISRTDQGQEHFNVNPDGSRRPLSPLPEHEYFWNGQEWERFPQHVIDNYESIHDQVLGGSGKKTPTPGSENRNLTAERSSVPVIALVAVAGLIYYVTK